MPLKLLDTNSLTLFQHGPSLLEERVIAAMPNGLAVTVITVISVEEQLAGWQAFVRRAKTDAQIAHAYQYLTNNVRTLAGLHIVTYSEAVMRRCHALLAMKLNIARMDLRIAAIALEENAVVITRNVRDFGRVPGLTCKNWAD